MSEKTPNPFPEPLGSKDTNQDGMTVKTAGLLTDVQQKRQLADEHRELVRVGSSYDRDRKRLRRLAAIADAMGVQLPMRPSDLLDKFCLGQLLDKEERAIRRVAASAGYEGLSETSSLEVRDRLVNNSDNLYRIEQHLLRVRVAKALTNYAAAAQKMGSGPVICTPLGVFQMNFWGYDIQIDLHKNHLPISLCKNCNAQQKASPLYSLSRKFGAYFRGKGVELASLAAGEVFADLAAGDVFTKRLGEGDWNITTSYLNPAEQAILLASPKSQAELEEFCLQGWIPQSFYPDSTMTF